MQGTYIFSPWTEGKPQFSFFFILWLQLNLTVMLKPSRGEALHTCQGERWIFLAVVGVVLGGWRGADAFLGNQRGCEELPPAMALQLKERMEMEMVERVAGAIVAVGQSVCPAIMSRRIIVLAQESFSLAGPHEYMIWRTPLTASSSQR